MLIVRLRRYWPLIPVAAVFTVAVYLEWSHKHTPQPALYTAAAHTAQVPAVAASQPPIPSVGQSNSNNQSIGNPGGNQIDKQSVAEATPESIEAAATQSVAHYTEVLACLTGMLALVALVQAGLFVWQLLYMRQGLRDATAATNAAAEQTALARRQYIAANRPRLRVRRVEIDLPVEGNMVKVRYEVINVGGTKAHIIDNEITIRISDMPAGWVLYHGGSGEVTGARQFHFADDVRQGEALRAEGEIIMFNPAWGFNAGERWWANRLFVIGMIRYTDDNGVMRRTAFYRRATEDMNRFEFMQFSDAQKADLEYED